jgi:hypothetical protein
MRFLILLLVVCPCYALPDSPKPKVEPKPPIAQSYWHKQSKWVVAAEFTAMSGDLAITCRNLSIGGREFNWDSQSCGQMVGIQLGLFAGAQGAAWVLHRLGHHKLEQVPRLYFTAGNMYGFQYGFRYHEKWKF